MRNFIGVYDDCLSAEECDKLINLYQMDVERHSPGVTGRESEVDITKKHSTDLGLALSNDSDARYHHLIHKGLTAGLSQYKDSHDFLSKLRPWSVCEYYNIQKYNEGEGFSLLHCEHDVGLSYRILAWMIYLNDAESGTEFPYQDITLQPKAGRVCIWPAAWTHPHKGVTPNKGTKYIATGWFGYNG